MPDQGHLMATLVSPVIRMTSFNNQLVRTWAVWLIGTTATLGGFHAELRRVLFRRDGGTCCKPTTQETGEHGNDNFALHSALLPLKLLLGRAPLPYSAHDISLNLSSSTMRELGI